MTKTVTAAALEAAKNTLIEARKTAAERHANHAAALNAAHGHRNEAIEHASKARMARTDFANSVRNGADETTRAELRNRIADHDALAAHHEAEAALIAESLADLQGLAEGGMRGVGHAEQGHAEAEFHDALAQYRDEVLPAIAPAVRRLHEAAMGAGRPISEVNWSALPKIDRGTLNGQRVELPA